VILDFQCELATPSFDGLGFYCRKKRPSNPFAAPLWNDCEVVDIEQGPRFETREPEKANGDADGLFRRDGEQHQGRWVISQTLRKTRANLCA